VLIFTLDACSANINKLRSKQPEINSQSVNLASSSFAQMPRLTLLHSKNLLNLQAIENKFSVVFDWQMSTFQSEKIPLFCDTCSTQGGYINSLSLTA
jgi:hypothetical protein